MNTLAVESDPRAVDVRCTDDEIVVRLNDGRTLAVPIVWFPRLAAADAKSRGEAQLIGGGEGIHWPSVDEDISVAGLLAGRASIEHTARR
jgi:hypothetical protein